MATLKIVAILCCLAMSSGASRGLAEAFVRDTLVCALVKFAVLLGLASAAILMIRSAAPHSVLSTFTTAIAMGFVVCSASTIELIRTLDATARSKRL